ncbi:MAG: VCBS repeat-containing protein [Oscillospiraceae bacterium]|nr:VCBS repeat-containing protein [Oscillospiraceae bacterium]
MKKWGRKAAVLCASAVLCCLLTGCLSASTVEDLFTLPQPPIEYTDLSKTIGQLIAAGYEYASPTSGQNIQSVQMVDLDADGHEEAITFFRKPSDEKPLKIMIFHTHNDGYQLLCTIESSGTAVDRVQYQDLNSDGRQELIVGWKISTEVQNVAVYAIDAEPALLMQSAYTRYSVQEMDGDGVPSLLLFRADAEGNSVAEFHGWRNDAMTMVNRTALSSTMAALNRGSIVTGALSADTPAVFVTGVDEKGVAVTDILVCREDGSMTNAALNSSTGVSGLIFSYRQLQPQDINGDGIIEVPAPAAHSEHEKMNDGIVDWLQCDMDGDTQRVSTTYHCFSSGWYFAIPEDWVGSVSASSSESGLSESQVLLQVDGQPVTALYAISGENRENRALRGNRMVLRRQTAIVYAGELLEGSAALEFDEDALRENFRLIVSSWTS